MVLSSPEFGLENYSVQKKLQRILCFLRESVVCDFVLGHIHSHPVCELQATGWSGQEERASLNFRSWSALIGGHRKQVEAETKPRLLLPTESAAKDMAAGVHPGYRVVELMIRVTVVRQRLFCLIPNQGQVPRVQECVQECVSCPVVCAPALQGAVTML